MVKANATFVLSDPETLTYKVFHVGEEIPEWALEKVTNPEILDGYVDEPVFDDANDDTPDETEGDIEGDVEDDGVDVPDESWKKAEIVDYLNDRGDELTGSETKDELLAIVHGED